ncbi:hypothetical protein DPMN_084463 [Dreissena polymorpha]|uniref:Uncharacterized protein n=1 Tax=Dreissena polymorpha TaxID=45954 RepID=A0A9D3YEW8_DREPO|nr:hypothetical protein DPMN_084463 [Dreissena polymorpha]
MILNDGSANEDSTVLSPALNQACCSSANSSSAKSTVDSQEFSCLQTVHCLPLICR